MATYRNHLRDSVSPWFPSRFSPVVTLSDFSSVSHLRHFDVVHSIDGVNVDLGGRLDYNSGMSKLAGLILILFGTAIAYLGIREVQEPVNLTPYASYTSIFLGVLLFLAGIGHFRAPHKSFLMTVPLLLAFQIHMYCVALFFSVEKVWMFLGGFLIASGLILYISYLGYRKKESEG